MQAVLSAKSEQVRTGNACSVPVRDEFLATLANVHTCYGLRGRKEGFRMALLTGYFDESGIHGADVCVVAGFIGNDAQWQSFIGEWVPAIRPAQNLHMKKLRWNQHPEAVARRLARLGPLPHKYNLHPIMAGMKWRDYNSVVRGKIPGKFTHPYILCALACVSVVLTELAGSDDVYFLLDQQRGLRRESMEELRKIVFGWFGADKRVRGIDFMRRQDTVCLDPADYLAYIVRERSFDMNSLKSRAGESIIGPGGNGGWIPAEHLEQLVAVHGDSRSIQEVVREMMTNPYFRGPRSTEILK